ncbi:hypothetical protein Pelo_7599 [Pelomyxa schiedti]|nr:hypothetical protein Pelo_7599 [Pelomyxa schiedti]
MMNGRQSFEANPPQFLEELLTRAIEIVPRDPAVAFEPEPAADPEAPPPSPRTAAAARHRALRKRAALQGYLVHYDVLPAVTSAVSWLQDDDTAWHLAWGQPDRRRLVTRVADIMGVLADCGDRSVVVLFAQLACAIASFDPLWDLLGLTELTHNDKRLPCIALISSALEHCRFRMSEFPCKCSLWHRVVLTPEFIDEMCSSVVAMASIDGTRVRLRDTIATLTSFQCCWPVLRKYQDQLSNLLVSCMSDPLSCGKAVLSATDFVIHQELPDLVAAVTKESLKLLSDPDTDSVVFHECLTMWQELSLANKEIVVGVSGKLLDVILERLPSLTEYDYGRTKATNTVSRILAANKNLSAKVVEYVQQNHYSAEKEFRIAAICALFALALAGNEIGETLLLDVLSLVFDEDSVLRAASIRLFSETHVPDVLKSLNAVFDFLLSRDFESDEEGRELLEAVDRISPPLVTPEQVELVQYSCHDGAITPRHFCPSIANIYSCIVNVISLSPSDNRIRLLQLFRSYICNLDEDLLIDLFVQCFTLSAFGEHDVDWIASIVAEQRMKIKEILLCVSLVSGIVPLAKLVLSPAVGINIETKLAVPFRITATRGIRSGCMTPLQIVSKWSTTNWHSLLQLVLDSGANPNRESEPFLRTVLETVIERDDQASLRLLFRHGASIPEGRGKDMMEFCTKRNCFSAAEFLWRQGILLPPEHSTTKYHYMCHPAHWSYKHHRDFPALFQSIIETILTGWYQHTHYHSAYQPDSHINYTRHLLGLLPQSILLHCLSFLPLPHTL